MQIKRYLANRKKKIDKELNELLPKASRHSNSLIAAMRYSVFPGGKRLRPILSLEAAKLCGFNERKVMTAACAVEFVHTFSLIHDDLPCMDNDDYRRGKLSCHRKFGEDVALLAGDALLNQAYTCLIKGYKRGDFSAKILAELVWEFSKAIGEKGLIDGQMQDLRLKDKKTTLEKLEKIYLQKTARLFILAVRSGAIISSSGRKEISALTDFAKNFGLAFQIVDDCEDTNRTEAVSYLNIITPEEARKKAKSYIEKAKSCLKVFGPKALRLEQIADFALES